MNKNGLWCSVYEVVGGRGGYLTKTWYSKGYSQNWLLSGKLLDELVGVMVIIFEMYSVVNALDEDNLHVNYYFYTNI